MPGVADLAVGVSGVEQAPQAGVSVLGDVLRRRHEQLAEPSHGARPPTRYPTIYHHIYNEFQTQDTSRSRPR